MGVETKPVKTAPAARYLLVFWAVIGMATFANAHPANVPVARAKVQVDGHIELTVTFDILAFILDQTPELVLDAPMNALLDGSQSDLQARLDAAKKRFTEGLRLGGPEVLGAIDSISFPTAVDIRQSVVGQQPRLPVMITATIKCHFKSGSSKSRFLFPEVMGPVVLSTEFPYQESNSESVEPGDWSQELVIPTQAQVDAVAVSIRKNMSQSPISTKAPNTQEAKLAIQKRYNEWSKAYMAHDLSTLFQILTPNYSIKTANGALITHDEYAVMLKLRKQKHSDTTLYRTEIVRITLRDGVAAVWSREITTDPGLNQKTGKPEPVSYQHDYIDLWIHPKGIWKLKSTSTQEEQIVKAPSG